MHRYAILLLFASLVAAQEPEAHAPVVGCRVDNPSGRVLVNLADFSQPLEGIERGELTFRVTNFGPAAQVPGVDRVETQATASRTWAVPLE